ncbi:MAG: hypothetical protein IPM50_15330 [Acidobacteriota bacterium]|nr:MAG: hypothetical protein IPM50_15330 [Acidobacteriota bacterium]
MRKREKEQLIVKLGTDSDKRHGRSVHVRPYYSDEKKLNEIAFETGEGKGAIVRRMIRFALSDKQERFGANRCRERLDWLIENERRNEKDSETERERLEELLERVGRIENEAKILSQKTPVFLRELYVMSNVSVSVMNIILSRLMLLAKPGMGKEQSVLASNTILAEMIAYAVRDLERCSTYHGIGPNDAGPDDLYFSKRIEALYGDLISAEPSTPEPGQSFE